jgi:hypothetical protein
MIDSWKSIEGRSLAEETGKTWQKNRNDLFENIFNKITAAATKGQRTLYIPLSDCENLYIGYDSNEVLDNIKTYFDILGDYITQYTYLYKDLTDREQDVKEKDENGNIINTLVQQNLKKQQKDGLYVQWGILENTGSYTNEKINLLKELELLEEEQLIEGILIVPIDAYNNTLESLNIYNQKKGRVI